MWKSKRALIPSALIAVVAFAFSIGTAAASDSSGVSVSAQGAKTIWMSTGGAGPKLYVTFTIRDPGKLARQYETCIYVVANDESVKCKVHALRKGEWVKPTSDGWIVTAILGYGKAVPPSTCDWANYTWPKFKSTISVLDKDGSSLARGKHGFTAKCSG